MPAAPPCRWQRARSGWRVTLNPGPAGRTSSVVACRLTAITALLCSLNWRISGTRPTVDTVICSPAQPGRQEVGVGWAGTAGKPRHLAGQSPCQAPSIMPGKQDRRGAGWMGGNWNRGDERHSCHRPPGCVAWRCAPCWQTGACPEAGRASQWRGSLPAGCALARPCPCTRGCCTGGGGVCLCWWWGGGWWRKAVASNRDDAAQHDPGAPLT